MYYRHMDTLVKMLDRKIFTLVIQFHQCLNFKFIVQVEREDHLKDTVHVM